MPDRLTCYVCPTTIKKIHSQDILTQHPKYANKLFSLALHKTNCSQKHSTLRLILVINQSSISYHELAADTALYVVDVVVVRKAYAEMDLVRAVINYGCQTELE